MGVPESINTRAELREALRNLYSEQGVSYTKLYASTEMKSSATIHNWTSGKTFPRWSNLKQVLQVWGITSPTEIARWRAAHTRAEGDDPEQLGTSLSALTDPFTMGVHEPISAAGALTLPALPPYLRRAHDARLATVVNRAATGDSAIAVLLGGSSTGKTRALWEALTPLRDKGGWRAWYPLSPSRNEGLQDGIARIGPRTVLWLNETQHYFQNHSALDGERIANLLLELLGDHRRAPVLILGTMWHEHYDALCRDSGSPIRKLLTPNVIRVASSFAGVDLAALRRAVAADTRIARACLRATDGRIAQYLAGGPELIDRYEHQVTEAARVTIEVAMDALRLGHPNAFTPDFLRAATAACLSRDERNHLAPDWFELVLSELTQPCKGAPGPIRISRPASSSGPPRMDQHHGAGEHSAKAEPGVYQLADYLDQHGRTARADQIPPLGFWRAVLEHASPSDLAGLADTAADRGLLRTAAQLRTRAVQSAGNLRAIRGLLGNPHTRVGQAGVLDWAMEHVTSTNPDGVSPVLAMCGKNKERRRKLASRAAALIDLDSPRVVSRLIQSEDEATVAELMARNPGAAVKIDDPSDVWMLLNALRNAGDNEQTSMLLARNPAAEVRLDDIGGVANLLTLFQTLEDPEQLVTLAGRAAERHSRLGDLEGWVSLLLYLRTNRATTQVNTLLTHDSLANLSFTSAKGVGELIGLLQREAPDLIPVLLAHNPAAEVSLDNPTTLAFLISKLQAVQATDQIDVLLGRDLGSNARIDDSVAVATLMMWLRVVNADGQAAELCSRAAQAVDLDDPDMVTQYLQDLAPSGTAQELVEALVARDPVGHVDLDNPYQVASVLRALIPVGALDTAADLALRAASHIGLDSPPNLGDLNRTLYRMIAESPNTMLSNSIGVNGPTDNSFVANLVLSAMESGSPMALTIDRSTPTDPSAPIAGSGQQSGEPCTADQAALLVQRLPAAGKFEQFLAVPGNRERFWYGREPDGTPSAAWTWDEMR
ncbi:hypothetical protein LTV02_03920 [Nocardia yamanashiensis]|uniref:hypothetical protein n=1 Tax=Nocardia yamanashiensis TaxID=209247 RepID=UPI001E2958D9|nr:hypothetical protein [Nocardia yamanashiensis]UGT42577.1 hypothetical protein LTV02_03920 [Nocardia yamanashiensis]